MLVAQPDAAAASPRPGTAASQQNNAERDQETLQVMREGVPLILGGRLPADPVGRWVGKSDLLVAAAGGGKLTSPCSWPSRKPLPPLHPGLGLPLHSGPGLPAAGDRVVGQGASGQVVWHAGSAGAR